MSDEPKHDKSDRVYVLGHVCEVHKDPAPAIRVSAEGTPVSYGVMAPAPEGRPVLNGELCYPRGDGSYSPVVEVEHGKPKTSGGWVQVATDEYRESYERTFGRRQPVGQA